MDAQSLRAVMARVPGSVAVVTTRDAYDRSWGFTANSFTSVSLDPPLVLVCLDKRASTHAAFVTAHRFLVNVLSQEQADIAQHFATSGIDRFAAGHTRRCELGLPGLPEASARLACGMYRTVEAGDHHILLGRVLATQVSGRTPLVYCDRAYSRLAERAFLTA
jgi:flavin reductase ActVB